AALLALSPRPGASQLPADLLDPDTEVRSIEFHFLDSETFPGSRLLDQIGLRERGSTYRLSKSLAFLPFFSEPEPRPFDPLNLQRDVARIREFYRGAGFPEAAVRYEVSLDQDQNLVDVEFLITEGRPRTLISLDYVNPSGAPLDVVLPPEILSEWRVFVEGEKALLGQPFGDLSRARAEGDPLRWLMDRGYPFPTSDSSVEVDSTGFQVRATVRIDPGSRSRVGSLAVEGASSVKEAVVFREIPIREGDWYSASRIRRGRGRISALDLFRVAVADVAPLQDPDSSVQVLFRVREAKPRSVSGFLGYTNVGGVALGGEWEHRNFLGGARTLSVNGTAELGVWAVLNENPDKYYRGSVSLRQPFFLVSGLSLVASPFGEFRDDYRDRSWEAGIDGTVIYQFAPLRAVSLRSRVSTREVLEYRLEDVLVENSALIGSSVNLDSLASRLVVSTLTLSATIGRLDDPANPRSGYVVQPSLEVTAPPGFPTNEYYKADVWGSLYRPLGDRVRLAGNLRVGRIFPFGRSVPSPGSDGLLEFIQLRDINLTAGGPTDVRGWGSRLLGPKIPDTEAREEGDTLVYSASRYLPLGGLARISGALELQFPLPRVSVGFAHVFVDGGRVWTPDDRYDLAEYVRDQEKIYYSAGGGLGFETPVGPIRISVGYKLNPSPLDLRDPGDVQELLLEGGSFLDAPEKTWRRFQFHLTVGRVF
ncbi:MAG: BamA/OMP85 family outer membrane protein, partial [Longimicrobiales bacterium]